MAGLEDALRRFRAAWKRSEAEKKTGSYQKLLNRKPGAKPKGYPFGTIAQRDFAIGVTGQLIKFVEGWTTTDQTFDRGDESRDGRSPRPKPLLRVMPPGSNDPRAERAGVSAQVPPAVA
jgi:hypothetical protein